MHVKALKLLFLFFVLLKAPITWGLSASSESYLRQAREKKLWQHTKWLRLGHYSKELFGYESPFAGPFFLHPEGSEDPQAELERTIVAFFEPSADDLARYKMPPQCYFQARRRWLVQELNIPKELIVECAERTEWKRRLNAQAVSLIFAASDLGTATSSFGHTFLKLMNPENVGGKELIDYGLNYAADADKSEGVLYAVKGLFGYYRGRFSLLPYHQKIREYTNAEGRDIWEYPLALTVAEVDELVDHLLELESATAPYYFLSNNCSYEIIRLLEVVRPDLDVSRRLPAFVIPIDTLKALAERSNLLQAGKFRRSLKSAYLGDFKKLNRQQRQALKAVRANLQFPEGSELSAQERAQVLEGAMKFYSLRAFEIQKDLDKEKYALSVQRARLGSVALPAPAPLPESPHVSHDSSSIALGWGSYFDDSFASLKLRSAFHELEQSDIGAVKFSHAEILSLEGRYYSETERWSLQRMTLINLLNSSPVNELERSFSWKARAEIVDQWQSELEAGFGYSYEPDLPFRMRFIGLGTAQYHRTHARVGPNLIWVVRLYDRIGLSLDSGIFFSTKVEPEHQLKAKMNIQLQRNWSLQFESLSVDERQVRLMYDFLL